MDITEVNNLIVSNRLIADFMGVEKCSDPSHKDNPCYYFKENYQEASMAKYHNSWDWLMPVVEKIESMGFEFCIVEKTAYVLTKEESPAAMEWTMGTKLEAAYQTVVQFIQWQKQKV